MKKQWQCRWAPSLGALEGTHQETWGTDDYTDNERPTVFFGLYGLPDFFALWRHKGEKHILWAGSDIRHFVAGYWLDEKGDIRIDPKPLAKWIQKNCTSWVENTVEEKELLKLGIKSKVCPSFLGDTNKFKPLNRSYRLRKNLYVSVSGNDFGLYRWKQVDEMAKHNLRARFYFYGNTKPWRAKTSNVIVRGRVPKEVMNEEIKHMDGAIRLLPFEGCSEIIVKAALMEQDIISAIPYPHLGNPKKCRQWFLKNLNKYPWNNKK